MHQTQKAQHQKQKCCWSEQLWVEVTDVCTVVHSYFLFYTSH